MYFSSPFKCSLKITLSFLNSFVDSTHRISIATMGKYDDLTNQIRPLRELDQSQVKVHTFGNPFKLKQDQV